MSIRFAGSRFVHERRRRRLAQECGGVSVVPVDETVADSPDDTQAEQPTATTIGQSPVSSIIRPQLWVHWMVTGLCFVAWAGMLYFGDLAERTDLGLRNILGLRSGRLTSFFSTLMLLWAGQLSLLIYWYRRKSRNDYGGRYRMWLWIGGLLQVFLAIAATGAHVPFSEYVQQRWPMNVPMHGLLCWLVPISTLSLALYRLLRIELKRHRSGKFLLNVAAIAGLIAAASLFLGPLLPERWRGLIQIGSATLAHLGLATALLMHARYVVHVCNEAPRRERPTRRLLAAARKAVGHLPLPKVPRLKLPSLAVPALSALKLRLPKPRLPKLPKPSWPSLPDPNSDTEETAKSVKRVAEKPRLVSTSASTESAEDAPVRANVETRAVETSRKKKRKPPRSVEHQRVDAAQSPKGPRKPPRASLDDILNEYGCDEEVDAETLRGLSKKERRRLRKKQRELQRVGQ